ncbi:hypothetical protein RJ639_033196, partial [Escallonia herrerae]
MNVHKCHEYGQPLPESFEPLANEPWTTGIFGCAEDTESCKLTLNIFCPCVLFERKVERLGKDTLWNGPCISHAIFVKAGITLAVTTTIYHGIDPRTSFPISEGLLFSWSMCGIYNGLVQQSLQTIYYLKVIYIPHSTVVNDNMHITLSESH